MIDDCLSVRQCRTRRLSQRGCHVPQRPETNFTQRLDRPFIPQRLTARVHGRLRQLTVGAPPNTAEVSFHSKYADIGSRIAKGGGVAPGTGSKVCAVSLPPWAFPWLFASHNLTDLRVQS